jgi:hypothetical protein
MQGAELFRQSAKKGHPVAQAELLLWSDHSDEDDRRGFTTI